LSFWHGHGRRAAAHRRSGAATETAAPVAAAGRLGLALPHFRAVRQIPLPAGPRLYAARRAGRAPALERFPQRLRGVAITDTRIKPEVLRDWHERGMRGLRFHLFPPGVRRGVGLDVFEVFRKTMADLGWVAQFFCDHRLLAPSAAAFKAISRDMPMIVDHLGMVPAERGVGDENFQALLKLVGDGHAYVKLSAVYRLSAQYPDYADARVLHDALVRANPNMLMWGTDWPHPSIAAAVMPDDGHLLDLFYDWTPDEKTRRQILVDTPARLFGK
jgi:2-pyrone-4,6-dicarboxylate lactonase